MSCMLNAECVSATQGVVDITKGAAHPLWSEHQCGKYVVPVKYLRVLYNE